MSPAPPVVVDARYCAPRATAFKVSQTFWNDLAVTDAHGAAAMRMVSTDFGLLHSYLLVDTSAASRRPVLTVRRASLFGIGRRWEAYRGESTSRSNLLFVAVAGPSPFSTAIHVHLAGRGERDPDFVVACGFFIPDYAVSRAGGGVVAQIKHRDLLFVDYYDVSVKAGVDHAFILALTAILEDIRLDDIRRKRT